MAKKSKGFGGVIFGLFFGYITREHKSGFLDDFGQNRRFYEFFFIFSKNNQNLKKWLFLKIEPKT